MSSTFVEVVKVDRIVPHPNADRLDVAEIKGTTTVVGKGQFQPGDIAVYFPPDILIPENVADAIGVKKYLKHAVPPGGLVSLQCRVAASRQRGIPSFGFLLSCAEAAKLGLDYAVGVGADVSRCFGAVKYEPPVKYQPGDVVPDHPSFHRYTDIQNFWRYPTAFRDGEPVRITEKIHGTQSRVGVIRQDGEFVFMAGSRTMARKSVDSKGGAPLYWRPLEDEHVLNLLAFLSDGQHEVMLFGEIFGKGVQDLDYGTPDKSGYRLFDITVNGQYLNWSQITVECLYFGVRTVPVLYTGPYSRDILDGYTYGDTTLAPQNRILSSFKGREGCVVTPITERHSDEIGGRLILKSVSADYLGRKGGEDNE